MKSIIKAPKGAFYLTDIKELNNQLPRGIFNKKEPGCGMTHLALTNDEHYIVVVPRVELVKDKSKSDSIQPVYSGVKSSKISFYAQYYVGKQKFITTYDGLPRLVRILQELGINPYVKFKLLVDEYHTFLDDYAFRRAPLVGCLNEAAKFEYVTYGSATPLTPTFTPGQLAGQPVTEIQWLDSLQVNVTLKQTPKPYLQAIKIIKEYKTNGYYEVDDKQSKEAIFFINSVKTIAQIIDKAGLKEDEVRVICGRDLRNKEVLGRFYEEKSHARFTFVTSAGYSGIDIESDSALTFVFSSTNDEWKSVDIARALHQISGRVRTRSNPFYRRVIFLYSTGINGLDEFVKEYSKPSRKQFNAFSDYLVALEEWRSTVRWEAHNAFEDKQMESRMLATEIVNGFNGLTGYAKESTIKGVLGPDALDEWRYIGIDSNNNFEIDEFRFKRDAFAFEEVIMTYLDGFTLRNTIESNEAYNVISSSYVAMDSSLEDKLIQVTSLNKKSGLIEYLDDSTPGTRKEYLAKMFPEFIKWEDRLGASRLRGLKYVIKDVEREYLKYDTSSIKAIREILGDNLQQDEFVSSKDLKNILAAVYNQIPVWNGTKASATDITTFFPGCTALRKKVNGSDTRGYVINMTTLLF